MSGEHRNFFVRELLSSAKLAAAIGEALTGKHFHSPCAGRGVLHQ